MAINVSNIVTALQAKQNLVTNDTDILEISKLLKAIINSNEELVSIVNISYVDGLGDALASKADTNTVTSHVGNTSNPHSVTKTQVGLGLVDNTSDVNKPVSTSTQTALDLKSNIESPTFTGTVSGITATMVGLSNVDNTSDVNKPVSTATQTALDLKADKATTLAGYNIGNAYTKTEVDTAISNLINNSPVALDTLKELADALGSDANFSTTVTNSIGLKAPIESPTFTGTVSGISKTMVGLSNVDNTSDANKPVSTATQTALNLKSDSSTVSSHTSNTSNPHSVTKTQVGLSNVDNTSDASKPVSTATQTALDLKANLASPTFTGTPLSTTPTNGDNSTKIATTAFVMQNGVPSGAILMWSGSTASIPTGWYLCNGANGTPNLQDRFVVGAGSGYAVGATGGSKDAIAVSHTHSASSSVSDPGHVHRIYGKDNGASPGGDNGEIANLENGGAYYVNSTSATTGISVSTTVNSSGSSATNANLPPYYALAYIMKS